MSKYVWIAAAALVVITVAILWWADRSSDSETVSEGRRVTMPIAPLQMRVLDGGRPWRPHPDRAGLLRGHRLSD